MCPPKPGAAPVPQLCCVIAVGLPWRIVLRLGGPKCRAKQVRGVLRFHGPRRNPARLPSPLTVRPFEPEYSRGVELGATQIWPAVAANGRSRCCHQGPGCGDAAR